MKKHPEDSSDWSEYVNNRDEWWIPENPNPQPPQNDTPPYQSPTDQVPPQQGAPEGAVGPYGATPSPWEGYDDRDPNPPRQSTPYDETSPWTNSTAWRYQQNPYRESPEEHRKGCGGVLFGGIALGLALVVIALILL